MLVDRHKSKENCYLGNINVKGDGVQLNFTREELQEYIRCSDDPVYFCEQYIKVINLNEGLVPFKLYPYQKKMFKTFNDNRFSIVLACRQSGKSQSVCAYLLWYICFHSEKTVAILANKGMVAREMLSRITLMLENLPYFLQPGCKILNKGNVDFSNNSRIIAAATSSSAVRGYSLDVLYCDEFAFVNRAEEFYTSVYPVVSSGKNSKIIITSTMNGIGNMYYRLYTGAVQKTNEFVPFRVDWWDVPGRDEKWKEQTIANTSEQQFRQEFGNEAIGTSSTLIEATVLLGMQSRKPLKSLYSNTLRFYEEPQKDHYYIITVDVSQGRGKDDSGFSVFDITTKPFKQAVVFNDNKISPLLLPDLLVNVAKKYNDALLIIENNGPGQVVCNAVYYDCEYDNTFVESAVKAGGIGVSTTKKTKRIGTSNLKDLIESGKLLIYDAETIIQLSQFEEFGTSFAGRQGAKDDIIMTLVLFSWFVSTVAFGEYDEIDLRKMIFESKQQEIEDEMDDSCFFIDTGAPEVSAYDQLAQDLQEWKK